MEQAKKTAPYKVITDAGGVRSFRFYSDISGELVCETKPIRADTEEQALETAWQTEGKSKFNRCPSCSRFVSSAMFNPSADRRLDCAPWEEESPAFCHRCGTKLTDPTARFCSACGVKLCAEGRAREEVL